MSQPHAQPSSTSGFAKRKRKNLSTKFINEKFPKITTFLSGSSSTTKSEEPENNLDQENSINVINVKLTETEASDQVINMDETPTNKFDINEIFLKTNPTDFALYKEIKLDNDIRRAIVNYGPCRPKGPFPFDDKHRRFSEFFYSNYSKSGHENILLWLCYSPRKNCVYCEVCWLFSNNKSAWSDEGISDWQGLSKKIKVHSKSDAHISACFIYEQWRKNDVIDKLSEKQIASEMKFWNQVLERLINITLMLAKSSLAFRGHREDFNSIYNGNFLSIVKLMAKYDAVLQKVVAQPKGTIKYLSHSIQNEIIDCLATKVNNIISESIKSAQFFSIIMDTTQDVSKDDQLSTLIRYVQIEKDERGKPISFGIKESFIGFSKITNQSADGLVEILLKNLGTMKLNINCCRGQGYDGASVMSGVYGGVQRKIKELESNAIYVHCAAHNLNLVINDAVKGVREIDLFFATLQQIYIFFGLSIHRWDILGSITGESTVTLKKLNPTRWSSRSKSIAAVKLRFGDIIKACNEIWMKSKKKEERDEAKGIISKIENFEFINILVFLDKSLGELDHVSKLLQSSDFDLSQANLCITKCLENIKKSRLNFEQFKNGACQISKNFNINPIFKDKRRRIVKKQFDELIEDSRITDPEQYFKINVFYRTIDILIVQLTTRFESLFKINQNFSFLSPAALSVMTEAELLIKAENLQKIYSTDLSLAFPLEIILMMKNSCIRQQLSELSNIKQLLHFLLIENSILASSFTEVVTALLLFLTLPVTVADAERSFSKLKIIKNYLRNTMHQNRLSNLATLSIEAEIAQKMNTDEIIKNFAERKSRRKDFC